MRINLFNNTKYKIDSKQIRSIERTFNSSQKKLTDKQVNLILTPSNEIINLNKKIFNKSCTTDVISIHNPSNDNFLGDIYICPDAIQENALLYKEEYEIETIRVVIHGILHLIGYDHEKPFREDDNKMFKLQEKLLNKVLKLSNYKYAKKDKK